MDEDSLACAWPQRPGEVVLVGVCGDQAASLWAFGVPGADVEVGEEARHAWNVAVTASARWCSVLWRVPDILDRMALRCCRVGKPYIRESGRMHPGKGIGALDGSSFGLPFLLAQISLLCDIPIHDIAATGELTEDGQVRPVASVALKTEVLARRASSRALTWIVPTDNRDEALEAAYGYRLSVRAVSTVAEAIQVVFNDRPAHHLKDLARQPETRFHVVDDLFECTWFHARGVLNWGAVANAARIVREAGPLPAREDFRVRFAEAVALRHHANEPGYIPVPDEATLAAMPAPLRIRFVAHLVQHCADTGIPAREDALRLANAHLVRGTEAFLEHLRLLGAYGRLLLVTGHPREAFDLEMEAAEGALERFARDEVSRPLSVAMWLSGVLEDRASFQRAEALWERAGRERFDRVSSGYLGLAWAAGRIALGEPDSEVLRVLEGLFKDSGVRDFLRWSAARFLVKAYRLLGREGEMRSWSGRVRSEASRTDDGKDARIAWALVRLDKDPLDIRAWDDLKQLDPGVCHHLEAWARGSETPPGAVASRFYPY